MTAIRTLTADDRAAYRALRARMLTTEPWAFDATVDDDYVGTDAALDALLARTDDDILIAPDPDRPDALTGAIGVMRRRPATLGHRATVWGLFVDPVRRGRGIGRALLDAALAHARSWDGVDSVGLSVSEHAAAACALYDAAGFEAWGREPACVMHAGAQYDEIHLVRSLSSEAGRASSAS